MPRCFGLPIRMTESKFFAAGLNISTNCGNIPDTFFSYMGAMTHHLPRLATRLAVIAALAGAALIPTTADAWWRGGVVIGLPPVVVGPPVVGYPYPYYAPPYYYGPGYGYYYGPYGYPAPPPGTPQAQNGQASAQQSTPQASADNRPYGATCYAGVYTCSALPQSRVGSGCACPGLGAPSYGTVH